MLFSIIIPTYNAKATINRCLDSVYVLPVPEEVFEVIIIDDCSTDETVEAIKHYEKEHHNLVLLIQTHNHRQGAARNRGIEIAQGEYIVFLDSDDEIEPGVLSAVAVSRKYDLDMAVMHYRRLSSDGNLDKEYILPYAPDAVFSGVTLQTEYPFWCSTPWAYLYRKAFLNRVNYPFAEDVLFEDSDFVYVHLYFAARMAYCNEVGYRMWSNPLSTTHTTSFRHVCDYAVLGTRMLSFYQQIEDKCSVYARSVLEGGSYNIMRSCKNLFKLKSISDVHSFYERFDLLANRRAMLSYSEPTYCWTRWTRFCMKHKQGAILIVGGILSLSFVSFLRIKG